MATTVSRELYNSYLERMAAKLGCPDGAVATVVDSQYPRNTLDALFELRARGYAANQWLASQYGKKHLRRCGRTFMWSQNDIDHFASELEEADLFTEAALLAAHGGVSAEQLIDMSLSALQVDPQRQREPAASEN